MSSALPLSSPARTPHSFRALRILKRFLIFFLVVYLAPLALHAAVWMAQERETEWGRVNWSSAELLPPPSASAPAALLALDRTKNRRPRIRW